MPDLRRHATVGVLVAVAALTIAACDAPPASGGKGPGPTSLAGTQWAVVAADNLTAPVRGREPTLLFAAETASGTGGCNSFTGTYAYDPSSGAIAFRDLSMTATACLDHPLNNFERAYFEGLGAVQVLQGDDLHLVLTGRGHRLVLVPRASDQPLATD